MSERKDLVLIGDGAFAEVAHEYFENFSDYRVVAFAVEREYLRRESLFGLPVVALDELAQRYSPSDHYAHVAVVYTQLNRLRARLVEKVSVMGYRLASFVSPHAFVSRSAKLGSHCFVFENNVVQSFVEIGDNAVLWSGNHIGHHTRIGNNVFFSSHVVMSGSCEVGDNCFFGVNAAIANSLKVEADCWVGPGVVISQSTLRGQLFPRPSQEPAKVSTYRFFRLPQDKPA